MKTNEELAAIRNEVEALNKKLAELSDEELKMVTGGVLPYLAASAKGDVGENPCPRNYEKMCESCFGYPRKNDCPYVTLIDYGRYACKKGKGTIMYGRAPETL